MKRGIVWFRNDLRVTDNEALFRASQECDEVLPVYVFDKDYLHLEKYGSKKFGARRVKFLLESLTDLKESLKALGADLLVETGKADEVLSRITEEYGTKLIYGQKEVTQEELNVEEDVKERLTGNVEVKLYHGHSLYHPEDIPFQIDKVPDVFSDFRKRCEKQAKVRDLFAIPEKLDSPPNFIGRDLPALTDLGFEEKPISEKAAVIFKGGERQARERLENYLWETQNLSTYKYTRNGLLGLDYSSKFSAWLAHGCISPRMIHYEVKRYEKTIKKNSSTYWLVFELIWRDYFRYVALKYGNRLFFQEGIKGKSADWKADSDKIDAWKKGETGVPFVDANMKELNATGFMSNRGRQIVASYFTKDLNQDWRHGAAYFEQELIDYDVTSNWGNWAYVAGVGNDPRENRYFNVLSQADRYDKKGEYVRHWLPDLHAMPKEFVHKPWMLGEREKEEFGIANSVFAAPLYVNEKW